MRIQGFFISFPKFDLFSHAPLRFLSNYRTEIFENRNSRMIIQQELRNVKCLEDGLRLYEEMRRMRPLPSVIQFNQLLSRLVKLEEYSAAVRLYRDFCCLGIPISVYTMTIAVNSYCHLNRVDFGFSILGSFFKRGCPSIMLDGLFHIGDSEEALLLLDQLEQKGDVHIEYYNAVMTAFCEADEFDRMKAIFSGLGSKGLEPNVVTYNILIKGCCQHGLLDEAKDLILQMGHTNLLPDSISYNCIAQACLKRGEHADAAKFIEEMVDKGFKPYPNTLELVFSLPATVENNPTLLRIARKLAPETFKNKNMGEIVL